jgi:hypothetical protein
MPPRSALSQRGRKRRMAGLSAIAGRCARLGRRQRIGRFVFDIENVRFIGIRAFRNWFALAPARRALGGEGADIQTLPQEVNALQI